MSRENAGGGPAIEARGLKTHFRGRTGLLAALLGRGGQTVRALDGVDFAIARREVVGLVGESGCGKSTLGMTLVRMHEPTAGEVLFDGAPIGRLKGARLKDYRARAQIIFQDPYSALNPRLTVGQIIAEPLDIHRIGTPAERTAKVRRALDFVRLAPADFEGRYPSDLSGGQRQRVAIARALALEPEFIVADEPVSMLDVSIQAGVLELLDKLARELGVAILYISHDIATVGYICDRVAVMYLGRVVEEGPVETVLHNPKHPYTERLMAAVPSVDPTYTRERVELDGDVPSAADVPAGCRFSTRCPHATAHCRTVEPNVIALGDGRSVRCHLFVDEGIRIAGLQEAQAGRGGLIER